MANMTLVVTARVLARHSGLGPAFRFLRSWAAVNLDGPRRAAEAYEEAFGRAIREERFR